MDCVRIRKVWLIRVNNGVNFRNSRFPFWGVKRGAGDEKWDIQIHYRNMYVTERQNITACVQCAGVILDYDTFKDSVSRDVYTDYDNFRFYAEPKIFAESV